MSKMKKWVLTCSCLVIAVCGIFAFSRLTLALFTDQETAMNTVSMGSVETEIEEETDEGFSKKNIAAKNTGTVPVYVRMMVTLPTINGNEPTCEQPKTLKWELKDDGYWYYDGILGVDESTEHLYDSITYEWLTSEMDIDLEQLQIIVYTECVQADNLDLGSITPESAQAAVKAFELLKPSNP